MPWRKFRATPHGLRNLLAFVFTDTDCRVYETYSQYDAELREFRSLGECEAALAIGVDPHGHGVAQQLALWSPRVMPPPTVRRIPLSVQDHSFRYTIEGCGLLWLHLGGEHQGTITESSLGYFTEPGARRKCTVKPGPDSVDWSAHGELAGRLRRQLDRCRDAR
jgi:hypothetical protein